MCCDTFFDNVVELACGGSVIKRAIILDCTSGEGICLIYSDNMVYYDQTKIHMYPICPILRSGPSGSPAGQ